MAETKQVNKIRKSVALDFWQRNRPQDAEVSSRGEALYQEVLAQALCEQSSAWLNLAEMDAKDKQSLLQSYSDCDFIRAGISPYDGGWLEDINYGHWELWPGNAGEEELDLSPESFLVARDPRSDIRYDSLIGIDFGTKSTVVVCQNDSGNVSPLPVGNGDIRRDLENTDYENPTVMQLLNLEEFLKRYDGNPGRPLTRWEDLKVSHGANDSMADIHRSAEFYSYLSELKQWAGEGRLKMNMCDLQGKKFVLPAYLDLDKSSGAGFDPIEVYAYYVGLYINNMHNGIYLNYLLSFPVTFSDEVCNTLRESFKRGLRKSLPASLQNDSEVEKRFTVEFGASEPAAYAICALQEYGFKPRKGEEVFYGIFDFGGGTSDFDFGLWTKAQDEDLYAYSIDYFGNKGDKYLGGENLLQLLAFEVFSQNIAKCREEDIRFACPLEMTNVPAGLQGFVSTSQVARLNQKLMMEKLRPFWERSKDGAEADKDLDEFRNITFSFLFNASGETKEKVTFTVDIDKLDNILHQRIEKGVNQFFEALLDTFSHKYLNKTHKVDKINIFLAGNASRSVILQEIIQQQMEAWNERILAESNGIFGNADLFELFPALGTPEAEEKMKQRGLVRVAGRIAPTGKTGVAWGLIEGRDSGDVEVKGERGCGSEAHFAYHLGIRRGDFFLPKMRNDAKYGEWVKLLPARRPRNELLYCSLPEALSGKLPYADDSVCLTRIEIAANMTGEDRHIYVRPVSVNSFEYAVGDADGNIVERTIKSKSL